jgi:hypothetical protein
MLRSIAFIALSLTPVAAAVAAPLTPVVAKKDGFRFEYTTAVKDGERVQIEGKLYDPNQKFSFTVESNGLVHGYVGYSAVSFTVDRKKRERLLAEVGGTAPVAVAEAGIKAN